MTRRGTPGPPRAALACGAALYQATWLAALGLASPVLAARALSSAPARARLAERLARGPFPPPPAAPRVLLHGVSVGEIRAARPLLAALPRARPGPELALSSTTDTGLSVARELVLARGALVAPAVRWPFDARPLVERFLARLAPSALVLVELELWPGMLAAARRRAIPVAVVNGRVTERSARSWARLAGVLRPFAGLALVAARSEEDAERFRTLGAPAVVVAGNVKHDALPAGRVDPGPELARLLGARDGRPVLVGGSTHAPEERLLAEAWRATLPGWRLVLAPRHPERSEAVERELAALGLAPQRLSLLRAGREAPDPARPALVDSVGLLERVWGLAQLAFVGGGFGTRGGQNVLEPAAQGVPVLFGPDVRNFEAEARLLERAGGARRVASADELGRALEAWGGDARARADAGRAARAALDGLQGATARTLEALGPLLDGLGAPGAPRGRGPA
jgi:3-deoxy-D-manno-octulosonic-acid transferase